MGETIGCVRSAFKMLQQTINNQRVGKKDEWEKIADYLYLLKLAGKGVGVYYSIIFFHILENFQNEKFLKMR